MTTYKVLTTIKANALVDDTPQKRAEAARANGYSCAQLGPGSAQSAAEEELLETWLLLEVRPVTVEHLHHRQVTVEHLHHDEWVLFV